AYSLVRALRGASNKGALGSRPFPSRFSRDRNPTQIMSTTILACPPAEKAEQLKLGIVGFTPTPEMQKGFCSQCQMTIWIGPKALEFLGKYTAAKVLCFGCARGAAGERAQIEHLGGTGGHYTFDPKQLDKP